MKITRRKDSSHLAEFSPPLHPVITNILTSRGVYCNDQINKSFSQLSHWQSLRNIDTAAKLMIEALRNQWFILIVGDFDVDGATSTALAIRVLTAMGARKVMYKVPNRFEHGYGLTPGLVDELPLDQLPDLIVTVDNGISSIAGVQRCKELGIRVLVTDHHLPGDQLPDADAIVNPNQKDCAFDNKSLAGVGVVFYLMLAVRHYLKQEHWFEQEGIAEPKLAHYLDLVAVGTVADVVPLTADNRILVQHGLVRIRTGNCCPGIIALLEVAKRDSEYVDAGDLGFAVGPRLNSAGRLDDMSCGIECLLSDCKEASLQFAGQLDDLNRERKSLEFGMQQEAQETLDSLQLEGEHLPYGIVLYDPTWHPGVIGILASRIKDKYNRPVFVLADDDDVMVKGSGRSIGGLNIRDVLVEIAVEYPDMIAKFGGHAMAAGLSMPKQQVMEFGKAFDEVVKRHLDEAALVKELYSDGSLGATDLTLDFATLISEFGPWGQHFPEPLFDGQFEILEQRIVGQKHLKMVLSRGVNSTIDAIAFNVDLDVWPNEYRYVDVLYKLTINRYRGVARPQLMVEALTPLKEKTQP